MCYILLEKIQASKDDGPMDQADICRRLAAQVRIQSQVSPYGIYGAESGNGTGFSLLHLFYTVSIIPPVLHTHDHINTTLIRRTSGRRQATFQKSNVA
jgi:hypothetical protein